MENTSGIYPVGERILIKPDPIPETTEGGIFVPDHVRNQHGTAQVAGTLIAYGPDAWSDYPQHWAKPGYKVMFAKYHGLVVTGKDGDEYRVLNDRDITAIIEDDVAFNDIQARRPMSKGK